MVVEFELRTLCENMNGIGLSKYLIDRWDDAAPINLKLTVVICYSPDLASMVLDAIKGSNQNQTPSSSGKIIKYTREAALRVYLEDNYSIKSQNEAIDKEVSALKAAVKIIKDQNFESEFTQEKVEERVEELHKFKALRRHNISNPSQQEPQKKGKK